MLERLFDSCQDNIERVDSKAISKEEFEKRFDNESRPCILTGVVDSHWDREKNWSWKVAVV